MSKSNNHQLIIRACTSLASATLCATFFLTTGADKVSASSIPLPIQSNVEKNVNQANHVMPDNDLFNSRHIMPRIGTDGWQNVDYSYDKGTKTLTIRGGTLEDPVAIFNQVSSLIEKINITGKLTLKGSTDSFFYGLKNLKEINGANNIDTSQVTDMSWMFYGCGVLNGLDVSKWNTSQVTKMSWMFGGCSALDALDVSGWDTSKVTDMSAIFQGCQKLSKVDVSKWNTSKVTKMSQVFEDCYVLNDLDVSGWNTSKVTDMSQMFDSCYALDKLDVSNWDTSQVTDMTHMFFGCKVLDRLDVSNWDTSKVTNMLNLFYDCYVLDGLDVSKWNTSQVTNMCGVFNDCYALDDLDVSGWDTSKVTDMRWMFENCQKLSKIDASNWDTSKVKYMISMLYGLSSLVELRLGPNINIAKAELNTPVEWVSVGKGTITKPAGTEYYSSDELSKFWNDRNYTETWVRGIKHNININYVDLDDNNKVIQTDSVSARPFVPIDYKSSFDKIVADLKDKHYEYVASEDKLPWSNGQIQLPDDVTDNTTYTVGFKHAISNVKDGDKNPVTGDKIDGLSKTVTQTIKYTGAPSEIADNVQKVTFTRNATVDLVTGKVSYFDWDNKELSFKDITSPTVKGYNSDIAVVKGTTVKPTDDDITKEVKYTRGNYKITINYVDTDDNNKVVKTDMVNGNPEKVIAYKDQMDSIVKSLTGYVLNKEKTNLPLDSDGNIKLADDILTDVEYQVGLKHDSKIMHAGDKNPVSGKEEDSLTKTITQTIKYTGAPNTISDNVQKVAFKRDADVDMVTGKLTYHDWDNKELSFKDVDSPKITGYEPDITTVKGTTVKPTDSNITKEVKYSRGNYNITINYVDSNDNGKVVKTDKVSGNPDKIISYQDQLKQILHDLSGFVIDKDKTTLPLDDNNDIKLPDSVTGDKDYQVVLKHDSKTIHAGDKNPVTGKDEDGLTKTITQTIKYTGAPSPIADNVQKVTFKRDADVDMVTGKLTYHEWDNKELSFKDVDSPKVIGYEPDITTVKGATVKPTDSDVTKEVKYSRGSYNITINYIDSNDNDKVIKTDKVSGNPDKVISYQDQLKQILHDLPGYVIDKNKTTLPLDSNNDIKLPDSVTGDKDYQVVLKHDSKTMHAGDKNPVTGKNEDGLTKTITQTIKYTGAPSPIADNVQKVVFERDADVDMVTGKLTYHDWNNKELSFKDVDSPKVAGYVPDIASVKGATVKPTDSDVTKEVKYSRGSYNIKIDYVDSNTGKVVKTDKVSGNPDKIISYQDQLKQILHDLPGYVIDKDKTTLPLDDNNDIKLPDSVTGDKDYQVVLNHDSKTMHAGDKNPVTGKDEDGLTKTVTQTIKYTGAPSSIADNMQKVTFKRSADVDMVTGKLTYHDWDNKELPFKDVVSPAVTGYDANPSSVKGATVTPDSSDITKTVTYVRSNYGIKINYVDGDDNNNILKTDAIEGNPETPIAYKGKMTSIINSLTGYILNKTRTDLPLNENGDIQLPPDVLGSKTYNVVLNHKTAAMKPGDKNPVTGKDEDGLTKTITRTIKYTGSPTTISDKVQKVTFTRNATVDLVTGELTYLDWDKDSQTLAEVVSPKVAGYVADPEIIKAQSVKPSDSDITKEVKYSRGSYNIKIDYVDSNTGKVVKTDKVSGNPDKVISYQDQLKEILHDLSGCVIDKDKTTLPLDDNNDIKLPADVTNDKDYQVVLKHDSKTIHAGDKNPVTGKDEDGLTKTITQTIKYTGAPSSIADNVQKVTFKRDADVDMVTGKLTYHDWDNKELSFKDVTSPSVDGYDADIAVVKGTTVKPTDSDITKTVTYTKKEAPSYDITINYTDDTNKVVRTDKQKGKAGTTIQYHDKLQEIINQIGNGKYEIDKDKSNLPLDNNNDIKLPDNLTTDHDYYVVLKHKIVTIKHGDKNPVTGELITGLTKDVKQVIKYTGTNKDIPDNVQTAKFTRNGKVDLVTGKVEYLDWNEKEQSFKDVASPTVSGYTPDITIVKGVAVTAGNSDIVKQVTYTKNKQDDTNKNDPDYEITIDYQDENGKTIKTDKQKGKANSTIPYKDRMQEIINSIVKNGYEVDWSKSNLPVDSDGNIKLGAITGNTNYKLVLKHKSVTFKHGEKNPFTGKEDPNLERKVTQTIKYLHSGKDLPNSVQELTFTRDAQVDMITGKVKYLAWHEKEQTFKDITSPAVNGYKPDLATVKGRTVTGDSKDIIQLVTYNNANVVQTGLDLVRNEQSTILGTIVATFVGILTYFGIMKKKDKKD